eukprot:Gb_05031 [translate_table: standard]
MEKLLINYTEKQHPNLYRAESSDSSMNSFQTLRHKARFSSNPREGRRYHQFSDHSGIEGVACSQLEDRHPKFEAMTNFTDSYLNEANKLDGVNYVNWKFKMQILMEGYNVWTIVSGTEGKPTTPIASVQDWKKRKTKAKVLLRMFVKYTIIPHIRDCKTSTDTWEVLKSLYEMVNTNRVLFLKRKLLSIKMEENENISHYLSRVKDLRDKLGDIGEKVSSSDLVIVTLNGMLHEYQVFITSLAAGEKAPSFDDLIGNLIQEEERTKNVDHRQQISDLALMAKGKQPYKGKPWVKNIRCKPNVKMYQDGASSKTDTSVKKYGTEIIVVSLDTMLMSVGKRSLMSPNIEDKKATL